MDSRKLVLTETAIVAAGDLVCAAVIVGVFAALGFFQWNVLWGALAGSAIVIVNHFFMAITVNMAADRAEAGETAQGKKMIQTSSVVRLVAMGVAVVVAIKLGVNAISLALPILLLRPMLMVIEFFRKKG